jgi:hypothetical protein
MSMQSTMENGNLMDRSIVHPENRVTCSHLAVGVAVQFGATRSGDPESGDHPCAEVDQRIVSAIGRECANNECDWGGGNKTCLRPNPMKRRIRVMLLATNTNVAEVARKVLYSHIMKTENTCHVCGDARRKLSDLALYVAQICVARPSAEFFDHIVVVASEFEMYGSSRA